MRCPKCKGPMLVESFIDMYECDGEDSGQLWLSAWRCVNCGQSHDPGFIRHWLKPRSEVVHPTKRFKTGRPALRTAMSIRLSA
jgi:hypothetical protein